MLLILSGVDMWANFTALVTFYVDMNRRPRVLLMHVQRNKKEAN